jgi:hypothetical protein
MGSDEENEDDMLRQDKGPSGGGAWCSVGKKGKGRARRQRAS